MIKFISGALAVALMIGTACVNKSTTAQTTIGGTTTAATTRVTSGSARSAEVVQSGRSAGAQAATRMTTEQLDAAMKTVNSTNAALGLKLMSNDLPGAAKDAQTLATTFADVERFWAQASKPDAVKLAQQARLAASESAAAATNGDGMKAAAARSNMTATCKQCHGIYREGDAQTGYRIKAGVL